MIQGLLTASACLVCVAMIDIGPGFAQTAMRPGQPTTRDAPKGTAVIRGRVTASDTGKPLRRAQLSLVGMSPMDRYSTSTNLRGEYEFKDIPAGRFTLSVSRGGYLRMQYGERRPGEGGKPLQLAEAQRLERVDLTLQRAGIISGRLSDETGEPIAGVTVYAMRQAYYLGRRRLVPMGSSMRTDDTGQYRLIGLEPGEYYVMATSRETWTVKGPPSQLFGYAVTYFPGAANPSTAQRVQVGSGQEVPNTDFALVASRTATLSGLAMRADGSPAAGGSVSLSQIIMGPTGGSSWSAASATVGADGSWRIEKVSPGEYQLSLSIDERERGRERTSMQVFVQGADMPGISLTSDSGADVSGEVTAENGATLPAAASGGTLRVVLDPIGPDRQATPIISGSDIGRVGADGRFTFKAQSGPNLVRVTGLPARWAIRSVEIGGRDYAGSAVDVSAGKPVENVRIVLTDKFPEITGTITDSRAAAAEGTIVLFPTDEAKWIIQGSIRSARADQYGLFRFSMVRPGDYYAVALDFVHAWQLPDPDFLAELAAHATKVTVREGQPEKLNLRIR